MALKQILTSEEFEGLADSVKEHYSQNGDEFKLDTDFVPEDVTGLKSALDKERKARKDLADQVKKYQDIDPEKAREAMSKLKEIEDKALVDAGEFETLKSRIASEKEAEVASVRTELSGKLEKTQSKLKQVMIERELQEHFAKKGGIAASAKLFVDLAKKDVALEGDDFSISIPDGKGNSIAEYVENLSKTDEFGIFFEADVATGSGASTQINRGGGTKAAKKASEMNTQEKSAYIREHGLDAWKKHMASV